MAARIVMRVDGKQALENGMNDHGWSVGNTEMTHFAEAKALAIVDMC